MTMPRYPSGSSAGSQACGTATEPAAYAPDRAAWNVNFNNGNSNWNNHNNQGFVRACCASECHGAPSLQALHAAWREARRGKKPSINQLRFEADWIDNLLDLEWQLGRGTWSPAPCTCFIATAPKAREIHAPDFADRIVHHWLVPQLEAIYEPRFIHDSYSNRRGKGTHAAVARLQQFVREVNSGQGGGWYLQLDIANFFNSIHRPTLYRLLKERMTHHGLPLPMRKAVHALLRHSPIDQGVIYACTPAERASVPAHKRLDQAPAGRGIAIGNLSSQFFANVYLDQLDQFIKHELKAKRYLRYVDDFVLVHRDLAQLEAWRLKIKDFLGVRLGLDLKSDQRLRPLGDGIDFLGYVIHPHHTVVRRRVISHAVVKLADWGRAHVRGNRITGSLLAREGLRSIWKSYEGHFSHARHHRLLARIHARFSWLAEALA